MKDKPCKATIMRCVALALPGKDYCECHINNHLLRPRELTRAERDEQRAAEKKREFPPMPWEE